MITVERVPHSGAVIVSGMVRGDGMTWRESRTYYGYGVSISRDLFREYLADRGYRLVKD